MFIARQRDTEKDFYLGKLKSKYNNGKGCHQSWRTLWEVAGTVAALKDKSSRKYFQILGLGGGLEKTSLLLLVALENTAQPWPRKSPVPLQY